MIPEARKKITLPKLSEKKITKRAIDTAPLPATGERFIWDSQLRGFGLRLYATGRRTFCFQYRSPGNSQTRRIALGDYPSLTVDQARTLARSAAGQVAEGRDPKGSDTEASLRRTLIAVFPEYISERRGKLAPRTVAEYERLWSKTLAPYFGPKRFSALDEATIARWHASKAATPTLANRAVDLLSSFCFWGERRGYRAKHTNPCTEIERYEEGHKGRSLQREEYQRLGAAMARALDIGLISAPRMRRVAKRADTVKHRPKSASTPKPANPVAIAAIRFLVLSGWREQEALTLQWDVLNLERGVAVLTDTKSGRSERPLGAPAIALLRSQVKHEGNPFVFPGERAGTHIADPKRIWQSVKHAARLEDTQPMRLHDLRHSFTTIARDELGYGDHVIARLVGHKLSGMTSRYGEVRDATLTSAATAVSSVISEYLSGHKTQSHAFPPAHWRNRRLFVSEA